MRGGFLAWLFFGLVTCTSGGLAQPISLAELAGTRIDGVIVQHRTVRTAEGKTGPNRTTVKYAITMLSESQLTVVHTVTVTKLRTGETLTRTFSEKATLERPGKFRDGTAVWLLQGESLVRLRTQKEGAVMLTFAFARTDKGLSCKLTAPFAREVGVGALVSESALGTSRVEILNVKEMSSNCSVSRP